MVFLLQPTSHKIMKVKRHRSIPRLIGIEVSYQKIAVIRKIVELFRWEFLLCCTAVAIQNIEKYSRRKEMSIAKSIGISPKIKQEN